MVWRKTFISIKSETQMKLSIAYITNRTNPRWEWFISSLMVQTTPEQRRDIQVIFVDGCLWYPGARLQATTPTMALAHGFYHDPKRRYDLEVAVGKQFDYLHIPPKPCLYQGPFRLTSRDFFCASNTRNTAIIAARGDYLVCVDDLSVLMPGWFSQVQHAAASGYCVCGAYKKVMELEVATDPDDNGYRVTYKEFPSGIDSRWPRGSDTGIVPWTGAGLFGCSFGARVEDLLNIDGSEPACNGGAGEDFDMGIRLERSGVKIFYNRNMLTLESEEGHHEGVKLPRERRLVSHDRLPAAYDSWEVHNQEEKYWSDHVLLNRVRYETGRILPLLPEGLRAIRAEFLATGMVPIPSGPETDWRDGSPLSSL
jgi:hypothetical protein